MTNRSEVKAIAFTIPEMNILMDMLKYAKDVYAQGAEPLPDMVKLMDGIIVSADKQIKEQKGVIAQEQKGLLNE